MKEPSARVARIRRGFQRAVTTTLGGLTLIGSVSCNRPAGPVRPQAPPQTPKESSGARSPAMEPTAPAQTPPPPPPPPPDLFERGPQVEFELGSELLGGIPQKFSRPDLDTKKLRFASYPKPSSLWLAVDHHAPRRARAASFTISELLNEDVELAPGSHYLVAFEWGEQKVQRLQLAAFFVDIEPTTLPLSPGCLLVTPELTKNGPAAEEPLRFLAVPLAAGIDRVEYLAQVGDLRSGGSALPGTEMSWKSLPGGDVALRVDCYSGSEKLGSDEQMVTLNPEARLVEDVP